MTKQERQTVFNKFGGKCAYCGCDLVKGWHVDHLIPIRRITKSTPYHWSEEAGKMIPARTIVVGCENPEMECFDNYMPSCASCNINKHSMSLEEFRGRIGGFIKSLNRDSTQYKLAIKYGLVIETAAVVKFHFETYHAQP